ncbi:hypothetical protein EW563_09640 [Salmonella enterica subsp. enterica serovar Typhimurium]|uniref:Uncharacterized protein n=1 Tax=Salmonella enterica subsp. enterica serovar Altona TaxID=1151173 RepID=A0A724S9B4_SALET|nr:hypothetical protein [Salmonella enterica subsp. enterica serovar Altona]EAY3324742.1 hypothetical protein [Salmonella enterica subsp. enterica serovar Typhimurium]HAE0466489.1 hypothetical protein [Salmonella enterica subsp. enterica serovar Altona]
MSAVIPKTGAWRGVVVVRHFVALRDESDAQVGCNARKIADSGAVLRSRGSKCLAAMQAAARKVKSADVATSARGLDRFRHGAAMTRDLAQIKGAEI